MKNQSVESYTTCPVCRQKHAITDEEIVKDIVWAKLSGYYTCGRKRKCECGRGEIIDYYQDEKAMMKYAQENFSNEVCAIMNNPDRLIHAKWLWYHRMVEKHYGGEIHEQPDKPDPRI